MIQAPKFQFKGKAPSSKKNRLIKFTIDATTCALIVGVFFFARHLRSLMPEPAHPLAKHTAPAAPKTVTLLSTESTPTASAPAPVTASAPLATSSTPSPGGAFPPVEAVSSNNTAESNLGGWIAPKSDKNSSASADPAVAKNAASDSATPGFSPAPTAQPAATKPPVSLGDSLMAVISPSARAETIQPQLPPLKPSASSKNLPASRQTLKVQPANQPDTTLLTEDQKLALAAQSSFEYVMNLAMKNPDIYGFRPNEPMQDTKLGEPIRVYTVTVSDRKNYQAGDPLAPLLQATNEWVFPVTLSGRVRFMIPVKRLGHDYIAETGSRSLAMVYEKILSRWPTSEGFHPQIVVNANISTYYFTIPELPDANLTDTSEMFEFNPTLSPASVILGSWR